MAGLLLLHGAWCGSWTWEPLIEELDAHGVDAIAVDLPIAAADAGVDDYVDVAVDALGSADRPLVVGHSLAGILLEPLAARRPVAGLVYLNAFVPEPGLSLRDRWRRHREMFVPGWDQGLESGAGHTSAWVDPEGAIATLFGCCRRGEALGAAARLRPQEWHLADSVFDGSLETPSHCIAGARDRLLDVGWMTADVESRLGTVERIAADHCPMLSATAALSDRLVRLGGG